MSGNAPTVSVVISCHNLGAYLDEAVQSALDQTLSDFEILLIDDGSTDPITQALFTSYRRPKTRVFRTESQGPAKTRNFGLAQSNGRFVTFLDADDLLEPAFLERNVAVLKSDPNIAFASCWWTAFSGATLLWNPTTGDFPQLLVEDTVCTAAVTRKEALTAAGGFDPGLPVPGYEHWDAAIGMVERGLRGRIVPEYLFRHGPRGGSISRSSTSPTNHARAMEYIVEKHADAYRRHLLGALEAIERRTIEMEDRRPEQAAGDPDAAGRSAILENTLRTVLASRNWRATRPVRRALSRLRRAAGSSKGRTRRPRISVVVTCRDDGVDLVRAFESASLQMSSDDEIVIADAGSTDLVTLQIFDGYRSAGIPVVEERSGDRVRARSAGLRAARGSYVTALNAGERFEAGYLPRALELLEGDPALGFVSGPLQDGFGFSWSPDTEDLGTVLGCPHHPFPVVRRGVLDVLGGYDATLPSLEHGDWDAAIRLASGGARGARMTPSLIRGKASSPNHGASEGRIRHIFEKHRPLFEVHWKEAILGHENWRRRLQAFALDPQETVEPDEPGAVDWGGLRRIEPVSRVWGIDRGQPIDRYYIERFISKWRDDIRGRVLEVKEPTYTERFGAGVERTDIVDIAGDNPLANLVADLSARDSLPAESFDCFVLTQTIHIIYDVREVLRNASRSLKPGGSLLATLPCVSRLDYESGLEGDFWRFTPASARRLVAEAFPDGEVEVETYGNVLACCGFLLGISAGELSAAELDARNPYFPLIVGVRAVKARAPEVETAATGRSAGVVPGGDGRAAILLYHRIDRAARDRWQLCVSPENFTAHMELLSRQFEPISLSRLASLARSGKLPSRAVAVTFDDGYRDSLTVALPALKRLGIPATFFLSGDDSAFDGSFWWEALDSSMEQLALGENEARELHARLMHVGAEDRRRTMEELPPPKDGLPPRMTPSEMIQLSREPLAEIGAHGSSHRSLAGLSERTLRNEVDENAKSLGELTGLAVTSFAYPFGGPETAATRTILGELGFSVACLIGESAVTSETDSLSMPRLEVRDCAAGELGERLARIFGG